MSDLGKPGAAIFLLLGLFVMALGLWPLHQAKPRDGDIVVSGEVVGTSRSRTMNRGTNDVHRLRVEFQDPETFVVYEVTGDIGRYNPEEVGKSMDVAYAPGQPHDARLMDPAASARFRTMAFIAMLMFAAAAALSGTIKPQRRYGEVQKIYRAERVAAMAEARRQQT